MDTRQLETLLAVAQHGSFAAAAKAVNLTPSAVSQQMAALEAELGASLFDRAHRPPVLSAKGAEVVQSARSILDIVTETRATLGGGRARGKLALGALRTASMWLVPAAVADLRALYPELSFLMRVGVSEDLMAEVVSGRLDAAVVAEHVGVPDSLSWTPVVREPLVLVVPRESGHLPTEEIMRAMPYVRYLTHVPLARQIETEIARLGFAPREIVSVNTMPAVLGCVHAGLGFAIVPRIALEAPRAEPLIWHPFGEPPILRRLGLVRRIASSQSRVLGALTDALSRHGAFDASSA